ncbi:hypothetical protein L3X38_041651 [Prunus dulcis]|uniref:Uncharacterized protein n=1 Tax=Prunus dulcis TaxID=3755 RepID=A0AAD4UUF0_PRUDU|nr:hypothetical protein L3X38_041651 [Prunus dulcis]
MSTSGNLPSGQLPPSPTSYLRRLRPATVAIACQPPSPTAGQPSSGQLLPPSTSRRHLLPLPIIGQPRPPAAVHLQPTGG